MLNCFYQLLHSGFILFVIQVKYTSPIYFVSWCLQQSLPCDNEGKAHDFPIAHVQTDTLGGWLHNEIRFFINGISVCLHQPLNQNWSDLRKDLFGVAQVYVRLSCTQHGVIVSAFVKWLKGNERYGYLFMMLQHITEG